MRPTMLSGVYPVLEVPFTATGAVDEAGFDRLVGHVLDTGVAGVMFPGFASEYHKLSDHERRALARIVLARTGCRNDSAAIISVTDHATHLAVDNARRAVADGADAINLLPPHLFHPSATQVSAHLAAVLAAVPDTPVIVQYAPAQTGTTLDAVALRRLAGEHPNLRHVKVESAPPGPLVTALGAGDPPLRALVGQAGLHLPDAVRRGAVGVQPGCSFTELYGQIWNRYRDGDPAGGDELHRRLLPYLSYWMQELELIIAVEKLVSARRGLIDSAYCRHPRRELDTEEIRMVDRFRTEFDAHLPAPKWVR